MSREISTDTYLNSPINCLELLGHTTYHLLGGYNESVHVTLEPHTQITIIDQNNTTIVNFVNDTNGLVDHTIGELKDMYSNDQWNGNEI